VDLAEMASKEPEVCPVCHLVACTVKDGPLSRTSDLGSGQLEKCWEESPARWLHARMWA
jgi:hypothetical protein